MRLLNDKGVPRTSIRKKRMDYNDLKGDTMKERLAKTKLWFVDQFEKRPFETLAGVLSVIAAVMSVVDRTIKFQNARTWRLEVERRRRINSN